MHEHVGHKLVEPEVLCLGIVKSEDVVEINAFTPQHDVCQIADDIDDKKIFCNCWYLSHCLLISSLKTLQKY